MGQYEENSSRIRPLNKLSSLLFNSEPLSTPNHDAAPNPKSRQRTLASRGRIRGSENDVTLCSEEERVRERRRVRMKVRPSFVDEEVIEIFSSSDEDRQQPRPARPQAGAAATSTAPTTSTDKNNPIPVPAQSNSDPSASRTKKARPPQTPRARRIVDSSSSESTSESDAEVAALLQPKLPPAFSVTSRRSVVPQEVIVISDSDDELVAMRPIVEPRCIGESDKTSPKSAIIPFRDETAVPLTDGENQTDEDDGSILVFDEPKSARKPIPRRIPPSNRQVLERLLPEDSGSSTALPNRQLCDDEGGFILVSDLTPMTTPALSRICSGDSLVALPSPSTPRLPDPSVTKVGVRKTPGKPKAPQMTKKAAAEAERARLDKYAHDLFDELNRTVFSNGMPKSTKLVWSKRLLTTAGKAKWHRSRDGMDTVQIELAQKVLDCEERIRNTLSHEMCHLACWLISNQPHESHGKVFRHWGKQVMKKRPDIEVSTRHGYDISYRYEWKCATCCKIYGRHSKSINPDEVSCGACKSGKLVPLFTTRAPKTPKKTSNSVASVPDLPRTAPQGPDATTLDISDDDVAELTKRMLRMGGLDGVRDGLKKMSD